MRILFKELKMINGIMMTINNYSILNNIKRLIIQSEQLGYIIAKRYEYYYQINYIRMTGLDIITRVIISGEQI